MRAKINTNTKMVHKVPTTENCNADDAADHGHIQTKELLAVEIEHLVVVEGHKLCEYCFPDGVILE